MACKPTCCVGQQRGRQVALRAHVDADHTLFWEQLGVAACQVEPKGALANTSLVGPKAIDQG